MTRRQFLAATAVAVAAAPHLPAAAARPRLIAFSKVFRELNAEDTAGLLAAAGLDGLELPVRQDATHIPLDRAADELPRFVEVLGKAGKGLDFITTDITRPTPDAEKLLRLAAGLGIRRYRTGWLGYDRGRSLRAQLAEHRAALSELAALNRDLGLTGGYQNHSGAGRLGAAIWDLAEALDGVDPRHLGVCLDVAHATIEGGLAWPTNAQLIAPHLVAVFVKDFVWERKPAGGARPKWVPLGEGLVDPSFPARLVKAGPALPVCLHVEYDAGKGAERVTALKRDGETLRGWLQ